MTVTIERDVLLGALKTVGMCANSGTTIPILSHFRVKTCDGAVEFQAHNLDQSAGTKVAANSKANGSLCVPGASLLNIVSGCPKGAHIELKFDGRKVALKSGRSRYSLPALPAEDLPDLLSADVPAFKMAGDELCSLLNTVRSACEDDKARQYMGGVFLHLDGDTLSAVATNHHRIHYDNRTVTDAKLPPNGADRYGAVLSGHAVTDLLKFCTGTEIQIACSPSVFNVWRDSDSAVYATKLLDCEYPGYQQIIAGATKQENKAILSAKDALMACERLLACANGDHCPVQIGWGEDGFDMKIVRRSGDEAEGHEIIEGDLNGKATAKLQLRYLIDAIKVFSSDAIEIHATGGKQAIAVRGASNALAIVSQIVV